MPARRRHEISDPRTLDILAWMQTLTPAGEYVMRLALRRLSPDVRGDRAWATRTEALRRQIAPDDELMAHFMREARKAAEMIADSLRESASAPGADRTAPNASLE
jgi:hypothetical protein